MIKHKSEVLEKSTEFVEQTENLTDITPYECWFKEKPDVSNIKVLDARPMFTFQIKREEN